MSKITLVLLTIGLISILGCAQQAKTPATPVTLPSQESKPQTIVIEEPASEKKEEIEPQTIIEEPGDIKETKETIKEFTMTAKKWEFIPETITVNKGDKVQLTITSIDVAHGFSLQSFGINERLEPNIPVTIEFLADKTGTFRFRCSVPCGSGHSSMDGTLVVK